MKDIADELIVIDTRSTDRTIEIAREYGAQVGHFEWCNDFAAARNASIATATGDWILFLDADVGRTSALSDRSPMKFFIVVR